MLSTTCIHMYSLDVKCVSSWVWEHLVYHLHHYRRVRRHEWKNVYPQHDAQRLISCDPQKLLFLSLAQEARKITLSVSLEKIKTRRSSTPLSSLKKRRSLHSLILIKGLIQLPKLITPHRRRRRGGRGCKRTETQTGVPHVPLRVTLPPPPPSPSAASPCSVFISRGCVLRRSELVPTPSATHLLAQQPPPLDYHVRVWHRTKTY